MNRNLKAKKVILEYIAGVEQYPSTWLRIKYLLKLSIHIEKDVSKRNKTHISRGRAVGSSSGS